jgi:hypothetical protein
MGDAPQTDVQCPPRIIPIVGMEADPRDEHIDVITRERGLDLRATDRPEAFIPQSRIPRCIYHAC